MELHVCDPVTGVARGVLRAPGFVHEHAWLGEAARVLLFVDAPQGGWSTLVVDLAAGEIARSSAIPQAQRLVATATEAWLADRDVLLRPRIDGTRLAGMPCRRGPLAARPAAPAGRP
jgi:hypothetical protein